MFTLYTKNSEAKARPDKLNLELTAKSKYRLSRCLGGYDELLNIKTGEIKRYALSNTIINDFGKLIACRLKEQAGFAGLAYWAVGTGGIGAPGSELATQQFLVNEIARVPITIKFAMPDGSGGYILAGDGSGSGGVPTQANPTPVNPITNILELEGYFDANTANGALNEYMIFGGNATGTKDTGQGVDYRVHGVITKTDELTFRRRLYLEV